MERTVHIDAPDATVRQLCEDYWAIGDNGRWREKAQDLWQRYGLAPQKVTAQVKAHSWMAIPNSACDDCGSQLRAYKRSEMPSEPDRKSRGGLCEACRDAREARYAELVREEYEAKKQRRDGSREQFAELIAKRRRDNLSLSDLSPQQAIDLLALLKGAGIDGEWADQETLPALAEMPNPVLTPSSEWTDNVVLSMHRAGLIDFSPDTPDAAFVQDKNSDRAPDLVLGKIRWSLLVTGTPEEANYAASAVYRDLKALLTDPAYIETHAETLFELGNRLAFEDAMSYLRQLLAERDLPPLEGKVTTEAVNNALGYWPVSIVYRFLFIAARGASDRLRTGECNGSRHASNQIPSHFRNLVQKGIVEGWMPEAFKRVPELPQSAMSTVLFGDMLGNARACFTEVVPTWLAAVLGEQVTEPWVVWTIHNDKVLFEGSRAECQEWLFQHPPKRGIAMDHKHNAPHSK